MKKELVDQMTLQEAFDFAVLKIVEQGGRCMNNQDASVCAYSNHQGYHCAVGWLLDESNKDLMNCSATVGYLGKHYPNSVPDLIKKNTGAFMHLQMFHDDRLKVDRERHLVEIEDLGIDVSKPQWVSWVEMGEDFYEECV